jgi:Fe-coproporphyrin III synthase
MLCVTDMIEIARLSRAGEGIGASLTPPRRFEPAADRPPVIIWNVCKHCNMTCPHCYAAASQRPAPTDLNTVESLQLIDSLAAAGVKILIFSGGEPLLRDDLFSLLQYAHMAGIAPHLSTNGTLIDSEVAHSLAGSGVRYVGISIDGPRAFNDSYRGLEGGYDAALEGLRCAKEAGLKTGLRMTLIRRNLTHLAEMHAVACSVGADRFYVSHLLYSGRGKALAEEDLSRGQVRDVLYQLFALAEEGLDAGSPTRIVTGSNDSDGPLLLRWIKERYGAEAAAPVRRLLLNRGGNSAGEGVLNIDARGRVHPDQFWTTQTLGDVREQSFKEILSDSLRVELRGRATRLTGRCSGCSYLAMCRGSHRERAEAYTGDRWASDPACVLTDGEVLGEVLA